MCLLTGPEIARRRAIGDIVIDPFDPLQLNSNSYNCSLADTLLVYESGMLDMRCDNPVEERKIPPEGLVLFPNELYIGSTVEYTETRGLAPILEGRSSVARLGLCVHVTAGFGDNYFAGTWTLELTVVRPLRVYAGVSVCQLAFLELVGEQVPYTGKYQGQRGPKPSGLWKDFLPKAGLHRSLPPITRL